MAGGTKKTFLRDVNPILTCPLCRGYLIDATTVVECSHSFCRSCILKHIRIDAKCPSCKHLLNTAKPNIKADKALQEIVYKLVPGLYQKEMRRRREFYSKHPDHADATTPEQRGEDVSGRLIFAPEDAISLSLEYVQPGTDPLTLINNNNETNASAEKQKQNESNNNPNGLSKRYLQCPALVTIAHLKKFLALKYSVDVTRYNIDICHRTAPLPEHWTLMDVAYTFAWKRNAPIRFFYRITQEEQLLEAPPNDRPSTPGLGATQPLNEPIHIPAKSEEILVEKQEKNFVSKEVPYKTESSEKIEELRKDSNKSQKSNLTEKTDSLTTVDKDCDKELEKQIKTPIKILKSADGRYQVMRSPIVSLKDCYDNKSSPKLSQPAEFSVVSIGDGANNNGGVKITLKQCTPGSNTSSKKPKVISNVLLGSGNNETINIGNDKQKRKVSFGDTESKTPAKKSADPSDTKNILHTYRINSKQYQSNKQQNTMDDDLITKSKETITKTNNDLNDNSTPQEPKNNQSETRFSTQTKLSSYRKSFQSKIENETISKVNEDPIDVYAFPSDPSPVTPISPGAVKRKCPPGLPISDLQKKTPNFSKKPTPVNFKSTLKCYRNQSSKQTTKKKADHQSHHANTNLTLNLNSTVSSTSSKSLSPNISKDTRSLLDGCGLNIPSSLSITLTASKSPTNGNDQIIERKNSKEQSTLDKMNPSITLNDKSVNSGVLKALKCGQMQIPSKRKAELKITAKSPLNQGPPAKKKKEESPISDLNGLNKMENDQLKIPAIPVKFQLPKSKQNWQNIPKSISNNDLPNYSSGQIVTLTGGQQYYRVPPGSRTPAVHRISDIPSHTPVYAPCFTGPSTPNHLNNFSSVFPSLQSLYALSQAPSLEQFKEKMFQIPAPKDDISTSSISSINKSHLAAQCAPTKPARSSTGSLVVPVTKPSQNSVSVNKATENNTNKNTPAPSINIENSSKEQDISKPSENENEVTSKTQIDKGGSSLEDKNQQDSASPLVSSTASPSPPPISNDTDNKKTNKCQSSKISEVTSSKSPESPDSSSVVNENSGNLVDSTKTAIEKNNDSATQKDNDINKSLDDKTLNNDKISNSEFDSLDDNNKADTSESLRKSFIEAIQNRKWANNPQAAEHLTKILKNLSSMQDEVQSTLAMVEQK